jgi:hypothetical protein
MIVEMVLEGWDQKYILEMPLPDFSDLYAATTKILINQKLENAHTLRVAMNGDAKQFKEYTKPWTDFTHKKKSPAKNPYKH